MQHCEYQLTSTALKTNYAKPVYIYVRERQSRYLLLSCSLIWHQRVSLCTLLLQRVCMYVRKPSSDFSPLSPVLFSRRLASALARTHTAGYMDLLLFQINFARYRPLLPLLLLRRGFSTLAPYNSVSFFLLPFSSPAGATGMNSRR